LPGRIFLAMLASYMGRKGKEREGKERKEKEYMC
jgi:hypothetical protein